MVPLPAQFPLPAPIHTSWAPNDLLPGKLPSPEPRNLSPTSMAPHRSNFTAALLPNAGDVVQLPSCTGPCASYSVLLVLPPRRPCEPYRSRLTPAVVMAQERLQLRICPESWRCFRVAVDHHDIALSLPPVATATAPASPTRQLDLPTSPCRQIGRTLI